MWKTEFNEKKKKEVFILIGGSINIVKTTDKYISFTKVHPHTQLFLVGIYE